jgi:hypothetical protein
VGVGEGAGEFGGGQAGSGVGAEQQREEDIGGQLGEGAGVTVGLEGFGDGVQPVVGGDGRPGGQMRTAQHRGAVPGVIALDATVGL